MCYRDMRNESGSGWLEGTDCCYGDETMAASLTEGLPDIMGMGGRRGPR